MTARASAGSDVIISALRGVTADGHQLIEVLKELLHHGDGRRESLTTEYGHNDLVSSAGTRTGTVTDRLIRSPRACRGNRGSHGDRLVPPRARIGALAQRDRHGRLGCSRLPRKVCLTRVHDGAGRQPAELAGTTAGAWSAGAGIVATVRVNPAYGIGHGPIGAVVSVWRAFS